MSLRDLATTAACAPEGASSSNPLANLANAILPSSSSSPASRAAHQQQTHRTSASSSISLEEAALLQEDHPSNFSSALPRQLAPLDEPAQQLYPKPPPFYPSYPPPTNSISLRPSLPPSPQVAATEVFEGAFRDAARYSTPQNPPSYGHYRPYVSYQAASSQYGMRQRVMSHIGHYENQPSLSLSSADMSREKYSPLEEMANLKVSEAEPVSQSRSWSDEFAAFEAGNVADSQQKGPLEEQNFLYNGEINDISQGWAIHNDFEAYQFSGNDIAHTDMSCEESVRRGVELREQGRLTGAVICFERALRRKESDLSPEMKAKAWYLLGLSLADTDDDQGAIAAFASGITEWNGIVQGERREDNPFFARSLVGLAVSYTNELNIEKAIYHMRVWTDLWEREHGISNVRSGEEIVTIPGMDGIDGLLERLQRGAKEHREDVEVVVVMGILQNVKRNYEAAADAFRIAVSLRADDAGLWNKLGATLANGKQKDNALRAYRKAVDLKPQLIRAWVNVGTAYANSGEFSKATRYYLKAVSMGREQSELGRRDDEGEDGAMGHVWGYLRLSVLSMGRLDALDLIETRDLDGLRQHFTF